MTELLSRTIRTARKEHICNYCGKKILIGERYEVSVNKDCGALFQWKSHEKCAYIAQAIWDYVEPDEGMTSNDFYSGCAELIFNFICPTCEKSGYSNRDCNPTNCIDKLYDLLQVKDIYLDKREGCFQYWKLKSR